MKATRPLVSLFQILLVPALALSAVGAPDPLLPACDCFKSTDHIQLTHNNCTMDFDIQCWPGVCPPGQTLPCKFAVHSCVTNGNCCGDPNPILVLSDGYSLAWMPCDGGVHFLPNLACGNHLVPVWFAATDAACSTTTYDSAVVALSCTDC